MARRVRGVSGGEEFSHMLEDLTGTKMVAVMEAACYAAIGVLADALKAEIQALPEEEGYMKPKHKRNVVTAYDKDMMIQRMGVSRIESTTEKADVVVGFNGYNEKPTKAYPKGLPIPLLARAIESGSSVRRKNPFIRRAFNKASSEAIQKGVDAGQQLLNDDIRR